MNSEQIEFKGHAGTKLAARLDRPQGPLKAAALFAHCFTCSKDSVAARRIARRLAALGIAVLRFDFTGLGHSEGDFADTDFSTNVEDLRAAARWMESEGMAPQLIIGHSLGGAAAIKAARQIPGVHGVVTIGAPFDPASVMKHLGESLARIEADGAATVTLDGRDFEIRKSFLDDVSHQSLGADLADLHAALLVLHSPLDAVVGIDNAARIYTAAKHPKSFVTLDDANHLLTREADAEYAADVIATWSKRYLDLPDDPVKPEAPEGVVRVSEADAASFKQDVVIGGKHTLIADEPVTVGGSDLGPSPYQLLSAGLGACTTMTLRMYARRKSLPLDHVSCDVTHDRCHVDDCEDCDSGSGKIDVFTRRIRLTGDLSDDQRTTLLAIADRCPVHKTLHAKARIRTELV